jgi:hypothetical protein
MWIFPIKILSIGGYVSFTCLKKQLFGMYTLCRLLIDSFVPVWLNCSELLKNTRKVLHYDIINILLLSFKSLVKTFLYSGNLLVKTFLYSVIIEMSLRRRSLWPRMALSIFLADWKSIIKYYALKKNLLYALLKPVLQIPALLVRIRILPFNLIRIRIRLWYRYGSDCFIQIQIQILTVSKR